MQITIPQNKEQDIINAFSSVYQYPETVLDKDNKRITNPETKEQFTKKQIIKFIKDTYKKYKVDTVMYNTRKQVNSDADVDMQDL